ncbi:putative AC9 transposase [Sesbania bispinosa]|nr:putative AC9 transposase [Sesbania bispinosa]
MKVNALRFYYSKLDPSTCDAKINLIKAKTVKLYEEYVNIRSNELGASTSRVVGPTQDLHQEATNVVDGQDMDPMDVNEDNEDVDKEEIVIDLTV